MIRLKPGARIGGLRPELVFAILVAEGIWTKCGAEELVITSIVDGKHKRGSEHYTFLAFDARTHNLGTSYDRGPARLAVAELVERLGPDYDVIFENEGSPEEHCHCEFDAKEPINV